MQDRLQSTECSRYLKALGDPDRLKIVQCLQAGPKSVSDLTKELGNRIANVSHHLGLLREAGVVTAEKRGRFVIYELAADIRRRRDGKNPLDILDFGCCRVELGGGQLPAKKDRV
jgi:DNA-binding transcriptional ArsR family regulator